MVTDDYSRYPVVESVNSTSSHHVIPVLDKYLMFRVSEIAKSDNGSPFQDGEFNNYVQYPGFTHRKFTPYHPTANGQSERLMKTLRKVVKIAATDSQPRN